MQAFGAKLYSLFAILLFFAAGGLRLSMLLFDLSVAVNSVYYLLLLVGIVFLALKAFNSGKYKRAFSLSKKINLNLSAFAAAIGFFIDFVHKCVNAYNCVLDEVYKSRNTFVPLCIGALFALLSCYFFYTVSLSYSSKSYDFRSLKLMHFSPLIWSGTQILTIMDKTANLRADIDGVVKCFVFIFAVCFFYRFSAEIEDQGEAKATTMFCSSAFSYLSAAFFVNRLMLLFGKFVPIDSDDGITSVTMLLVAIYAVFFEKSIANQTISKEI